MHSCDNVRRAMQNAKRGCWSYNRYREKYKLIVTLIMVLANEKGCFLTDPIGLSTLVQPLLSTRCPPTLQDSVSLPPW